MNDRQHSKSPTALSLRHREDLASSGLSEETIAASGCYSVGRDQTPALLGWPTSGMAIPYPATEDEAGRQLVRVKQDPRPTPVGGSWAKYVSPKREIYGLGNRLYVPATVDRDRLQDPNVPLIITEGEKKTLKANQEGFLTVGLAGVSSWRTKNAHGKSEPLGDLQAMSWRGRPVAIVYDSDIIDKPQVRRAAHRLRDWLVGQGARVFIPHLPPSTSEEDGLHGFGGKLGLDDFLIARGPDALRALLEQAEADAAVPVLVDGMQEREVSSAAADALVARNDPPSVFVHCGAMTRILREPATRLSPLNKVALQARLSDDIDWFTCNSKEECSAVRQPPYVAPRMIEGPDPRLPKLRRLATTPVYAADGRLLCAPGYHEDAQVYLELPDALTGAWPGTEVTRTQVEEAVHLLRHEWLGDFAFASDADFAIHLGALLVPLVRDLIDGLVPFHAYTAPTRGVGKTKLATNLARLHFGAPAVTDLPTRDEEVEKRITTFLMEGHPVVIFDNVDKGIDSPSLARLGTGQVWTGRILGESKSVTAENRTLWMISGKNPAATDEIARRVVSVRLLPTCERPWDRQPGDFRHPELEAWTEAHRRPLLAALVTLVEWWKKQGRPEGARSLGSYESYARVVGGIVTAAGVEGFLANRDAASDQLIESVEERILRVWEQECPEQVMTTAALLAYADGREFGLPDGYNAFKLGRSLSRYRARVFGDHRFDKAGDTRKGKTEWHMVPLPPPVVNEPEAALKSVAPTRAPAEGVASGPQEAGAPALPDLPDLPDFADLKVRQKVRQEKAGNNGTYGQMPDLPDFVPGSTHIAEPGGASVGAVSEIIDRTQHESPASPAERREAPPGRDEGAPDFLPDFLPDFDSGSPAPPSSGDGRGGSEDGIQTQPARPRRRTPVLLATVDPGTFTVEVDQDAREAVAAIEAEALAQGWARDDLWATTDTIAFPSGRYGVVCSLRPGTRIVEVTSHRILLAHPDGSRSSIYNARVEQPWVRRTRKVRPS